MANTSTTRAKITPGDKSLTDSPTNLKEAIDWILRITNQDGLENPTAEGVGAAANAAATSSTGTGGVDPNKDKKVCICQLAEAVRDLFRNVEQQLEPWERDLVHDIVSQIRDVGGTHEMKNLILRLGHDLGKFVRGSSSGGSSTPNGIINGNGNYKSYYKKDSSLKSISNKADDLMTCARILMGAIPFVFSGLSYLYWLLGDYKLDAHENGEANDGNTRVGQYMQRMGYKVTELVDLRLGTLGKDKKMTSKGNVFSEVFQKCGILGEDKPENLNYAQYLDQLRQKTEKSAKSTKEKLAENALIKLNILCAGYFRSLHTVDQMRKREPRMPRTVREILYGDGVNCDGCPSWQCPQGKGINGSSDQHSSDPCGQNGKGASPLQAFLCDCLKGFTCDQLTDENSECGKQLKELKSGSPKGIYEKCYPDIGDHRQHILDKPGQYCPIPMGFKDCFRDKTTGGDGSAGSAVGGKGGSGVASSSDCVGMGINAILECYANWDISQSSLYQITRCISSLTRRVPRSTGTIFGFFYGLGNVYVSTASGAGKQGVNDNPLKEALLGELRECPGFCKPEDLMASFMKWRTNGHKDNTHKAKNGNPCEGTFDSLYRSDGNSSFTCGRYIFPLSGTLYNALAPQFCDTYISWMVYLSGRLKEGLKALLSEFNKINCQKSGCGQKTGGTHCCEGGQQHKDCKCENVVKCAGVLSTFYRKSLTAHTLETCSPSCADLSTPPGYHSHW
ncbi:variant erythrocyte surface antigen alpha subunit, putative [Babesia ovis]|uniref:Variant erythrocyte surface antigen alpha subunit, putative n=1 Tax=Babesia ovis TaxID=5869 RepID=A0A9W5TBA8_BABOV|nr:variant erythrocyte surface antigen alpha subunit, putative [Babesia ovis]